LGQKQTSQHLQPMSALPPKADIGTQWRNVRFVPKADPMHRNIRAVTFAIGWNAFGACSCIITGVKIGLPK
jgi:hypothetical protein